ncbi:STM4504/CBY_0614 family protein [Sphingobium chlorophenolicum]|uniref:Abortive infection protein-like C-terminal domain-containing protein n=1 Tax=Sphingobium chlorophenolicum TaxID=46429 RepID=A0A081R890_SPHCR|nr:hypothetical protein [Sphingobium chlorophenolicum]KEQ51413.1 hypothetical protein BV95_04315 [Sphingobium chlorophenolicum]
MIYELLSRRKKKFDRSGVRDVYQYDTVPGKLRVQVQQILIDAIGPQYRVDAYAISGPAHNPEAWEVIHKILCRELGRHRLTDSSYSLHNEGVLNYLGTANAEDFIDALEVCCRVIDITIGKWNSGQLQMHGVKQDSASALQEINYRLKESALGYEYADGQMIRMDSEYTHEELIKPALVLLSGKHFEGAQEEFLDAHKEYRAGNYQKAIVSCAKSFESALKVVCKIKGWPYEKGARASDLLRRVRSEGLWPDYLDGSFDQLLATLTSGLPKVRNDAGAHGQGPERRTVPPYVAAYALQLCAAKIKLIAAAAE